MSGTLLIIPSIRFTQNFEAYATNFKENSQNPDIIILDEQGEHRQKIREAFSGFHLEFFGADERNAWFNSRGLKQFKDVIPKRAHNELSFAYLIALERDSYETIIQVDDDTRPYAPAMNFIGEHKHQLVSPAPIKKEIERYWINTHPKFYVRGFPYNQRHSTVLPTLTHIRGSATVLNMGLWAGVCDLNAIDYIVYSQDAVTCDPFSTSSFKAGYESFLPICSMNLSFRPEIIPAYYQLWHNDRYDDIFSGLFLKSVADHLRKSIKVGYPLIYHEKAERDLFKDAETEWKAMRLNEELWKIVQTVEYSSNSWHECYRELTEHIRKEAKHLRPHYIQNMTEKMTLWSDLIDKLMSAHK